LTTVATLAHSAAAFMGGPCTVDGVSYDELDNFLQCSFELDGVRWTSVEQCFQAAKFLDVSWRERIRACHDGDECWRLGNSRAHRIRPDWEAVKVEVMYNANRAKFTAQGSSAHRLRAALLSTGSGRIIAHGSPFWAHWNGVLLERLREELRPEPHQSASSGGVSGCVRNEAVLRQRVEAVEGYKREQQVMLVGQQSPAWRGAALLAAAVSVLLTAAIAQQLSTQQPYPGGYSIGTAHTAAATVAVLTESEASPVSASVAAAAAANTHAGRFEGKAVSPQEWTGASLWESGEVLALLLPSLPHLIVGKRVLELGSGCGRSGLTAAAMGAGETYLTDHVVHMARFNLVRKTPLFEPFIYKMHLFTKTGSGQT
jgi:ribA/ribD-fused uncharacterized protein